MIDTKVRILDAAERLIAEHGMEVSLRAITAGAGVNLAAVNYHFQSKDALIDALIARRFEPVNARRLQLLDAIEARYEGRKLPLDAVLEAFLAPVMEFSAERHFRPLMGRCFSLPEEVLRRVILKHLKPVSSRFSAALGRAAPDLPETERVWRMIFAIGAMVHVMNWSAMLPAVSGGVLDPSDTKAVTRRVVAFAAAGFRGPLPKLEGGSR